jgi:hypothetical protein
MEVGSLNVTFTSNLGQLNTAEAKARQSTEGIAAATQKLKGETDKLLDVTKKAARNQSDLNRAQEEGEGTSSNLGRAVRIITTNMLGTNVATIALGTALGNILTQRVTQVILALARASTQFAQFHNQLLLVETVGARASDVMRVLEQVAQTSSSSIADLHQRFTDVAQAIQGTTVNLDQAIEVFRRAEEAQGLLRENTIAGATSKLLDDVGKTVLAFDEMLSISNALIGALQLVANVVRGIGDVFRSVTTFLGGEALRAAESFRASLRTLNVNELRASLTDVQRQLRTLQGQDQQAGRQSLDIQAERRRLAAQELAIRNEIAARTAGSAVQEVRRLALQGQITTALQFEASLLGVARNEAEIRVRVEQIRLQFLQLGVNLTAQELANYRQMAIQAQLVTLAQREMTAQAQNMVNALSGIPVQFGSLFINPLQTLQGGFNSFTQELTGFHTQAFRNAFAAQEAAMLQSGATAAEVFAMKRQLLLQEQNLTLDTASKAASAITSIFPKSKAAAIGAAVINTAVGITRALQLPPPFSWIQAALVAATGAAQIASIRSASPSGGSTPTVGSGGGAASEEAAGMMPQMITIELQQGALFSSEQVVALMAMMREQVGNGHTLFATRLI